MNKLRLGKNLVDDANVADIGRCLITPTHGTKLSAFFLEKCIQYEGEARFW